ncbi:MAG: hypothetical protein WAO55_02005 [Candidatus Manganitrophaceae bacterium]
MFRSKKKTSLRRRIKPAIWIVLILSFLTLSLANACLIPEETKKGKDCCAPSCRTVSSPELAKSFCHLSDQQRSLHTEASFSIPLFPLEDALAFVTPALQVPLLSFVSFRDTGLSGIKQHDDLCILHRTLLL